MWSALLIQSCALAITAHAEPPWFTFEPVPVEAAERAEVRALAWLDTLEHAQRIGLETYVRETHIGSGSVYEQYARGTYTADGFTLEVWTPEQFEREASRVDERLQLVSNESAEHTMVLTGDDVRETLIVDHETGERREYEYHRLDPLRDELVGAFRRMAADEAKEADLPADEWLPYIDARVDEELREALQEPSPGIPFSQARRYEKCLTGSAQAGYAGEGGMIETHREFIDEGEWSPEPAERNGLLCYALVVDYEWHTHTFWYSEEAGLVCWETTQYEWETPADEPRVPEIVRERFYTITATPRDASARTE